MTSLVTDRLDDGVAIFRINRPHKRNALDSATLHLLNDALADLSRNPGLRALVFSTPRPRPSARART